MFLAPIEPPSGPTPRRHDYAVVRLLRRWAATRASGERQLPSMVKLGRRLGFEPQAAVAVASLFQLIEACLGRPLVPECCCSTSLSHDEQAVLLMLAAAPPAHPHDASATIPHGLPGALVWAIESVRRLIGLDVRPDPAATVQCPFRAAR